MLPEAPRIGLVEDDLVMGGSIVQRLELEGWDVLWWQTGRAALVGIPPAAAGLDLVICDLKLPDMSGEHVFHKLANRPNLPPFLFVTGYGDIDQAVRLMRSAAVDFMTKPFIMDEFLKRIDERAPLGGDNASSYALGVSPVIHKVEDQLRRFAFHDLPVLITGETGSGKEIAAALLHQLSAPTTLSPP